jgi:steroid 5-alpha reductase family enzyme
MTGFATHDFLVSLPLTLAATAVLLLVTLAISDHVGRHSGIDVTWGLGFVVVATVAWALSLGEGTTGADVRRTVVLLLTAAWGLRLAFHIWLRARKHEGEDPRYEQMLSAAEARGIGRTRYAVTHLYLTQGISLWFISLPVQVAVFGRGGIGWLEVLGILVWAVGLFFEAVGDYQLTRFRADPGSRDKVLDTGLWRYTRHPNYFGDACVWWGLSLIAFAQWPGILTLLSPVLMTWLLAKGTGATLLESTIGDRRKGYVDYVKRTSGFVPLPPRRPS